jgi:hypothetical protein
MMNAVMQARGVDRGQTLKHLISGGMQEAGLAVVPANLVNRGDVRVIEGGGGRAIVFGIAPALAGLCSTRPAGT